MYLAPMRFLLLLITFILTGLGAHAQDSTPPPPDTAVRRVPPRPRPRPRPAAPKPDSLRVADSLQAPADSVQKDTLIPVVYLNPLKDSLGLQMFQRDSAAKFWDGPTVIYGLTNPVHFTISVRRVQGKDAIFYTVIGLLLFFALVKTAFPRYLLDLFRAYFRTTLKQRQVKEQLLQSPLPSLLLNVFFMLSVGLFITLVLAGIGKGGDMTFWMLYLYVVVGISTIYLIKFITLKFFGWVFQMTEATDNYIFVVFATNKIASIAILPFLFVLPFAGGALSLGAETLGLIVIACLLVYRFFLTFASVHRLLDLSFFHFLLYLAAFEIVPLLIINKLVLMFLS